MFLEEMLDISKEVRAGLIAEVAQIPTDQFTFQATPQSRSVAGLIRHIVETQKFLVGELTLRKASECSTALRPFGCAVRRPLVSQTSLRGGNTLFNTSNKNSNQRSTHNALSIGREPRSGVVANWPANGFGLL